MTKPFEPTTKIAGNILVVDDNSNNLSVLCNMLEGAGYKVRPAISGALALRSARSSPPDLILLDIRMPEMDGYAVCRELQAYEKTQEIPIIFISALQELNDKVAAFRAGAVDYVVKPFQLEEVLARVKTHLLLSQTRSQLQIAYEEMEQRVEKRTKELLAAREQQFQSAQKLRRSLEQTIAAIARALEKRDPYTAGHQKNVSLLATAMAEKLGLSSQQIEGIRLGGLIHDIGKIAVPAEILNRPGALNPIEFDLIRTHPEVGYEIVKDIDFPWPVAEMVYQHHERIDGSGYPNGLKEDDILIESQIIAVADVVEAMSSHRPYRPALGIQTALNELKKYANSFYRSELVDVVVTLFSEDQFSLPK